MISEDRHVIHVTYFMSVAKFLTEASLGKKEASFGLCHQKEQSTMVKKAQLKACGNVKCLT